VAQGISPEFKPQYRKKKKKIPFGFKCSIFIFKFLPTQAVALKIKKMQEALDILNEGFYIRTKKYRAKHNGAHL
jgi:hypothetical protein